MHGYMYVITNLLLVKEVFRHDKNMASSSKQKHILEVGWRQDTWTQNIRRVTPLGVCSELFSLGVAVAGG